MKTRQKLRKGLIISAFLLFPAVYYYMSPYLSIEATGQGIVNGSLLFFFLLFVTSLLLGRAYCGWVCPAAGCQEIISVVRTKRVKKGNFVKWLIWIPWISVIVVLIIKNRSYQKIDILYQTTNGLSISDVYGLITYLFVLLLIALPAFIIGRRSFCHHICWMAPFMILGRKLRNLFKWPSLQLSAEAEKCEHCHTCTEHCPMSLEVEHIVQSQRMENSECILCGTCIDGCEHNVIQYRFKAL